MSSRSRFKPNLRALLVLTQPKLRPKYIIPTQSPQVTGPLFLFPTEETSIDPRIQSVILSRSFFLSAVSAFDLLKVT